MPVITYTQEIPSVDSIKVVPVHPSLYEGAYGLTSILGHKTQTRGLRLVRYAPILMVAPIITGPVAIDEPTGSFLNCWRGVVDSAPTAKATFQWRLDGVDIPGETSENLLTLNTMDKKTATCFVRFENNQGFIETESNGIALSRIENIVVDESEFYSITGQSSEPNQNAMILNELLITGLGVEGSITNTDSYSYMITGLGLGNSQSIFELDIYGVRNYAVDSVANLMNPDAELGIANWIISEGDLQSVISAGGVSGPNSGTNFFYGGIAASTKASQTVTLDVPYQVTVDAGETFIGMEWFQNSKSGVDTVHMWLKFLDTNLIEISSDTLFGPIAPKANIWNHMNSGLLQIPMNTRYIQVNMDLAAASGNDVNAYVDDISLSIYAIDYT